MLGRKIAVTALKGSLAGMMLLLSSCGSSKTESPLIATAGEITYDVRLYEVPAKDQLGQEQSKILTSEQTSALLKKLDQEPALSTRVTAKWDERKTLNDQKEFVYVTEWSDAGFSPQTYGKFPVAPPTPSSFETTTLGNLITLSGEKKADGVTGLEVEFDRKVFLGFLDYGTPITAEATDAQGRKVSVLVTENKIEKPLFRVDRIKSSFILREGHSLLLQNPDAKAFDPGTRPFTTKSPPYFLAIIQVVSR